MCTNRSSLVHNCFSCIVPPWLPMLRTKHISFQLQELWNSKKGTPFWTRWLRIWQSTSTAMTGAPTDQDLSPEFSRMHAPLPTLTKWPPKDAWGSESFLQMHFILFHGGSGGTFMIRLWCRSSSSINCQIIKNVISYFRDKVESRLNQSYSAHLWGRHSGHISLEELAEDQPLNKLARENCPMTFSLKFLVGN